MMEMKTKKKKIVNKGKEKKIKRKKKHLGSSQFPVEQHKKFAPEVLKGEYFSACAGSCSPKPCLANPSCAREGSVPYPV